MKESRTVEWKESITNTFLKTVSAYANYGTGKIIFGIRDDGLIVGLNDVKRACMDIENRINDSIDPVPDYAMETDEKSRTIVLCVNEGRHKPYFYKSKAYRRNDTATIEIDRLELTRLILEGENRSFEALRSTQQEISFVVLDKRLKDTIGLKEVTEDVFKTLELYTEVGGYNNAAALLADENSFSGIDIIRFGDSINIISDRETIEHISVLMQYDRAIEMYRKYYQYEEIKGSLRETIEKIPEEAFRESIANALVHRTWDVPSHIRVAMFEDRIEIISPGGLPKGITEEEYLKGYVSILRNPILGGVFFRLQMIERFGTGIQRINDAYRESDVNPIYEITMNTIKITLPVFRKSAGLSHDEQIIYDSLKGRRMASSELAKITGFGKTKTVKLLKKMVSEGYIRKLGTGRGTKYQK